MGRSRGYVHRVDVRAEVTDVWQALVDPTILARWHVPDVRVDPREGGSYWTRLGPRFEREAHIDIFKPPQRLRLLYLPAAELPDSGSVPVDDFLLDRDQEASRATGGPVTVLRLMGSGIPEEREWDPMYIRLRGGWERALLRLKAMFEPGKEAGRSAAGSDTAKAGGTTQRRLRARAQPQPREDKTIEWPQPGDSSRKQPPADDFIPWPEPTDKKR
ncbi:MAG TPA: SRPBCC domain-containing protein [Steroidobacteraceae bacterium]|jgi:uncharacterized protein YndB with AHSA1/START domain|nr:SRPBCC domain-containing protein [Steroidobacteraceae bacterium]